MCAVRSWRKPLVGSQARYDADLVRIEKSDELEHIHPFARHRYVEIGFHDITTG
jgi:hypothetical protein